MDVVLRKGYLGEGFGEGNVRGLTGWGGWRIHFCVFLCVFFKGAFLGAPWSALRSLWAPAGAKSEHFGCQKVSKKCQKSDFLQNQGKLIWSGKYHTILRVGPSKKALKTVQKGA